MTAPVLAVAIVSGVLVIGTNTGQILFVQVRDLPSGPAIAVAIDTTGPAH